MKQLVLVSAFLLSSQVFAAESCKTVLKRAIDAIQRSVTNHVAMANTFAGEADTVRSWALIMQNMIDRGRCELEDPSPLRRNADGLMQLSQALTERAKDFQNTLTEITNATIDCQ